MPETRTQAIAAAITRELDRRRLLIDVATDLGEVTITVRLQAPSAWVRGVEWTEERVYRINNGGQK